MRVTWVLVCLLWGGGGGGVGGRVPFEGLGSGSCSPGAHVVLCMVGVSGGCGLCRSGSVLAEADSILRSVLFFVRLDSCGDAKVTFSTAMVDEMELENIRIWQRGGSTMARILILEGQAGVNLLS